VQDTDGAPSPVDGHEVLALAGGAVAAQLRQSVQREGGGGPLQARRPQRVRPNPAASIRPQAQDASLE
jgi:hypothetical protein